MGWQAYRMVGSSKENQPMGIARNLVCSLTFTLAALSSKALAQPTASSAPPNLASELRISARASFEQGAAARGREQLGTLLGLYREWHGDTPNEQGRNQWRSCLAEVAQEYLREDELRDALVVLGEAAELDLAPVDRDDNQLASAAAALYRRLASLYTDERFELLSAWSMPTESRQTIRILNSLVPQEAPPKEFARAIGERPRDKTFPVAEINGIDGLFSTAWLLVKSADETGRLGRLIDECNGLFAAGVPQAEDVLMLARIVANDPRDERVEEALRERLAILRRERPPQLSGKGPVPGDQVWQFGYTDDADRANIDFRPPPFWSGSSWQGAAEHPDSHLGWTSLNATGGHTGIPYSPVRRWVAPADGTLIVNGQLRHTRDEGDGVRARIVTSREGVLHEWRALSNVVTTATESLEVRAWEPIDFVVDRVATATSDRFFWSLQLTLNTRDGKVLKFDSAEVDPGPTNDNALADLTLAAACAGVST